MGQLVQPQADFDHTYRPQADGVVDFAPLEAEDPLYGQVRQEVLAEIHERLTNATTTLRTMIDSGGFKKSYVSHLMSKSDGIRMVLSYIEEMQR